MRQFDVSGMSCSACSTRVEKAVSKLDGVSECSVSLLMNSMSVEGDVSDEIIIEAVEKAGYLAKRKDGKNIASTVNENLCKRQCNIDVNSNVSETNNEIGYEEDFVGLSDEGMTSLCSDIQSYAEKISKSPYQLLNCSIGPDPRLPSGISMPSK